MIVEQGGTSVLVLILLNILTSVAIVTVNKYLVEIFHFKFVLLLSALHFATGYAFLRFASSDRCKLFTRAEGVPQATVIRLGLVGAGSIALLNYSLRLNSVGTYQIMKTAILPATMGLSVAQKIISPSRKETAAAALVVAGTLVATASDVWVTAVGLMVGVAGVLSTAQYQIWQGTVQSENKITSTQALYLMSLPQAVMTLCASIVVETDWSRMFGMASAMVAGTSTDEGEGEGPMVAGSLHDDIWHHPYSFAEAGLIFVTCVIAVMLNYSTIAIVGKTSAVTMQFVAQVKTVLTIAMGFLMFPRPMPGEKLAMMGAGLTLTLSGVFWYNKLKASGGK